MTAPRHIPVLGPEAVALLSSRDGGVYLDATFGAGGYSRRLLETPGTRVIAIDRDPHAIAGGAELVAEFADRLTLVEDTFSNLAAVCAAQGIAALDGVVMDVGVSSMQLDEAARGFSFRLDGPLDMRMAAHGPSAADVIARADEADIADVIYAFGEERQSRRIARAIVAARATQPITTTRQLADIVAKVIRAKPNEIHPATRTFQGLRILVNAELDELQAALVASERMLKPGGRLAVVSFHSLEDRIVKTYLASRGETRSGSRHLPDVAHDEARFLTLTRRPIIAGEAELRDNPRARSAKLRGAERTAVPARDDDAQAKLSTTWPTLASVLGEG